MKYEFTKEDFTEEELMLLRMAFKLLDDVVETQRDIVYYHLGNDLFHLKEKLGIYELVD